MLLVSLAVALALQLVRGEDTRIDLLELVKPVLLINLPGLALTAALAEWFDLVPWLRRSAGNVVFFMVLIALISVGVSQSGRGSAVPPFPGDLRGLIDAEYEMTHHWPAAREALAADSKRGLTETARKTPARDERGSDAAATSESPGLSVGTLVLEEGTHPTLVDWPHWKVSRD